MPLPAGLVTPGWPGIVGQSRVVELPIVAMIDAITSLSQDSNLLICLDAGDGDSYTSGDKWLDVSGNGYDFNGGAAATTDGDEPTFNGTPDALTSAEYWTFGSTKFFRYDTTNEARMNALHKNNALYTALFWVYTPSAVTAGLFGDVIDVAEHGAYLALRNTGFLQVLVGNGGAGALNFTTSTLSYPTGRWNLVGMSLDEAAGAAGSFMYVNGSTETFDGTYSSPSSSDSARILEIGAIGAGGTLAPLGATDRMAAAVMWEGRALSVAEINSIFLATRNRFGL